MCCYFPGRGHGGLSQVVAELAGICGRSGLDFLTTEGYGDVADSGEILVSSALCGGTLEERFAQVVETWGGHRVVMDIQPMGEDFLLPSPQGSGRKLSTQEIGALVAKEGAQVYFSPELCARYFTYQNGEHSLRFVLFDDEGTVAEKIRRAESWGIGVATLI